MSDKRDERVAHSNYRLISKSCTPSGVENVRLRMVRDSTDVLALTSTRDALVVREFRPGPEECLFGPDDARRVRDSSEGLDVMLMPLPAFREHLRTGLLTDTGCGYRGLDALGLL